MLPDRVSNPGPLTYESGALPIALRGPAEAGQSSNAACLLEQNTKCQVYSDQDTNDGGWIVFHCHLCTRNTCYMVC